MFPFSAVLSLAGTAISGALSAYNNRRAQEEQRAESARREAYYNAKAAEDPLANAKNQRLLNQYDRKAEQQITDARSTGKILGSTPEYALGVQKAVAQGRADLMGNISANAADRADKYNEEAERVRQERAQQQQDYRASRNETFSALASNAMSSFGSFIDAYAGKEKKE